MIDIQALLQDNELFQGGFILMMMGAVLAYIRYLPKTIMRMIRRWWTSTLQIRDSKMVQWTGQWFSDHKYAKKCRRLNAWVGYSDRYPSPILEPGLGTHLLRHNKKWVVLVNALEESGADDFILAKKPIMTMFTLGRDSSVLRQITEEVVKEANQRRYGKQVAHINGGSGEWLEVKISEPRKMNSIILPDEMEDEIFEDAKWFLKEETGVWHLSRGLPYRRGYLFYGPPGNGKSTMIQVLSGACDLPIYIISLTEKGLTDARLVGLMARLPTKAIVAIEDIDKMSFCDSSKEEGVTLAGLLNSVDGVLASTGRIFIITANDISNLPDMLLRPGRIDQRWEFGYPGEPEISKMFNLFYPEADGRANEFGNSVYDLKLPMAAIQQHLAKHETPESALASVEVIRKENGDK